MAMGVSSCFSKIQLVLKPFYILSHIFEFCLSAEGEKFWLAV